MDRRIKFASALFYIAGGVSILLGLIYLLSPRILPFHEQFLGIKYEQLAPRVADLMIRFMRDLGGTFIALGVGVIWLVRRFLTNMDRTIIPIVSVMSLIALIPLLYNTISGGWYTPWWVVSLVILLIIAGFMIVRPITSH